MADELESDHEDEQIKSPTSPQPAYRVAGLALLRLSSTVVTVLAMAEIYVGLRAYLFKSSADVGFHFVGAFWVGMYTILPGILGMLSNSKPILISGFITGMTRKYFCVIFAQCCASNDLKFCFFRIYWHNNRIFRGNTFRNLHRHSSLVIVMLP